MKLTGRLNVSRRVRFHVVMLRAMMGIICLHMRVELHGHFQGVPQIVAHIQLRPMVSNLLQEGHQCQQLPIVIITDPALDRHAILNLEGKGGDLVVHDDQLGHVPREDGEILDEGAADGDAVVAVKAMPKNKKNN